MLGQFDETQKQFVQKIAINSSVVDKKFVVFVA